MPPTKSLKSPAREPGPSLAFPGKEILHQAWNLFVFSAFFAVLFNVFYSDGIDLKVTAPKHSDLAAIIRDSSSQAYTGWKRTPVKKPGVKPPPAPSPSGLPPRVSLIGAKERFDRKVCVFLDARKPEEYREGHIPGALNFYGNELDKFAPLVIPQLTDKNKEIIVYCHGGDCDLSLMVAKALVEAGYLHVEIFAGGWPDWKKAAYPVSAGEAP